MFHLAVADIYSNLNKNPAEVDSLLHHHVTGTAHDDPKRRPLGAFCQTNTRDIHGLHMGRAWAPSLGCSHYICRTFSPVLLGPEAVSASCGRENAVSEWASSLLGVTRRRISSLISVDSRSCLFTYTGFRNKVSERGRMQGLGDQGGMKRQNAPCFPIRRPPH